ncbi:acyl carrier protein [Streptomyces sp. NPDC050516]|uniref:acyl carrier protein n=1 Tax=Streptomyces sp. NPDC050516 TaxID=3365621 RepID=UPI0037B3BA41
MYETIKEFFVTQFTVLDDQFTPDAFLTDIGIDSPALVELALILEQESGIPVDDDALKSATTLRELAELAREFTDREPVAQRVAAINACG